MGYKSTTAQLFTVPPNMAGFVVVIVTAHFSDKIKQRGIFIVVGTVVGMCGYVMLLASNQNAVKYAGTFLIAMGVFQASPMLMVGLAHIRGLKRTGTNDFNNFRVGSRTISRRTT